MIKIGIGEKNPSRYLIGQFFVVRRKLVLKNEKQQSYQTREPTSYDDFHQEQQII